jgi:hypothetical protein
MADGSSRRRWGAGALIALVGALVGIVTPFVVTTTPNDLSLESASVLASSRDAFVITSPIEIVAGSGIRVERGRLFLLDRSRVAASGVAADELLASGTGTLVIEDADVRVAGSVVEAEAEPEAPLAKALSAGRFATLVLQRTAVRVVHGDRQAVAFANANAEVVNRQRAGISIKGGADLYGMRHAIDLQLQPATDRRRPLQHALKGTLKGGLINLSFDGRIGLGATLLMQGQADVVAPELRRTAGAFGLGVPEGPGIGELRLRGRLDWQRSLVAFDKANFQLGASEATGTLSLRTDAARPAVAGTLDVKVLDATRFLDAWTAPTHSGFSWSRLGRFEDPFPLADAIDLDLRLSAGKVQAGGLSSGPVAATVALRRGKLLADIAELELAGGSGRGQLEADFGPTAPRYSMRLQLQGIDASRLRTDRAARALLEGQAVVTADLKAEGASWAQVLRTIAGRVVVALPDGGTIGLDGRQLRLPRGAGEAAWDDARAGSLGASQAEARLRIEQGIASLDDLAVRSSEGVIRAGGSINLADLKVDVRVVSEIETGSIQLASGGAERAARPGDQSEIRGTLLRPELHPARARGSAITTGGQLP